MRSHWDKLPYEIQDYILLLREKNKFNQVMDELRCKSDHIRSVTETAANDTNIISANKRRYLYTLRYTINS